MPVCWKDCVLNPVPELVLLDRRDALNTVIKDGGNTTVHCMDGIHKHE